MVLLLSNQPVREVTKDFALLEYLRAPSTAGTELLSCLPFPHCFYYNTSSNFHVSAEKNWYLTFLGFLPANDGTGYTEPRTRI